jgi:hypothetical protein
MVRKLYYINCMKNNVSNQGNPAVKPSSGSVVNLLSPKQKVREAKTYYPGNGREKFSGIVFRAEKSPHKPNPYAKDKSLGTMRKLMVLLMLLFPFILLAIGAMTLFPTGELTYYYSGAKDVAYNAYNYAYNLLGK